MVFSLLLNFFQFTSYSIGSLNQFLKTKLISLQLKRNGFMIKYTFNGSSGNHLTFSGSNLKDPILDISSIVNMCVKTKMPKNKPNYKA